MWRYEDLNNDNVDVIFDKLKNNDSLLDRVGNNGPELTDDFIEKEIEDCKKGLQKSYRFYK